MIYQLRTQRNSALLATLVLSHYLQFVRAFIHVFAFVSVDYVSCDLGDVC